MPFRSRRFPEPRLPRLSPPTALKARFTEWPALTPESTLFLPLAALKENYAPPECPGLTSSLRSIGRRIASGLPSAISCRRRIMQESISSQWKHWRPRRFRSVQCALVKVCQRSPTTASTSHTGACEGGTTPFYIPYQFGVVSRKQFHHFGLFQ